MYPTDFCTLNEKVQDVFNQVENGTWPHAYAALTYYTTVVCLSLSDLTILAKAMGDAAESVEQLLAVGDLDDSINAMCQPSRPQVMGFDGPKKRSTTIDINHLLKN